MLTQSADQLPDLPRRQPESFGRAPRLELAVRHVLNDLEPVQLAHRHRDPFRCSHRSLQRWIPSGRSAYDGSKSGHLNLARSGHYNLAATITKFDHVNYVILVRLANYYALRRDICSPSGCIRNQIPAIHLPWSARALLALSIVTTPPNIIWALQSTGIPITEGLFVRWLIS